MRSRALCTLTALLLTASAGSGGAVTPSPPPRPRMLAPAQAAAWAARTDTTPVSEPWIITTRVTVTQPMDVGDIIVADGGELIVRDVPEPGFSITGNLWVVQSGRAELRNSVIRFLSTYNGQYSLLADDDATILVDGCDYRIPSRVHHGLVSAGNSSLTIRDTVFGDVQLMAFQNGRLVAQRLNGHFEVILQDTGHITLKDIPRDPGLGDLWVWPTFPKGSTAVYSPPLPGFIEAWDFPPPGATGIRQACHLERCQVLLWPLLVQPGSDLTLKDIKETNWVVVGLHLPNPASISGMVNGGPPVSRILDLADRTLRLENASIDTWNLYPEGHAQVTVEDSVIGEILAFDDSTLRLDRSTIDGTGGYFGASATAYVIARASTFTCDIEATGQSTVELHQCNVLPSPQDPDGSSTRFGAYDRARLLADATVVKSTPALGGSGIIAVTWIANPPAEPPGWDRSVKLSGVAAIYSADPGATLSSWELLALPAGSASFTSLGLGSSNVDPAGPLGVWHGGEPYIPWVLRLVLRDGFGRILSGSVIIPSRPTGPPRAHRPTGRSLPQGH